MMPDRDTPRDEAPSAPKDETARVSMLARHKVIEAMIENNLRQLKSDSVRGGAEIERACALRDCEKNAADEEARARLEETERRIRDVDEERRRLAAEREWLEQSLREFDKTPDSEGDDSRRRPS